MVHQAEGDVPAPAVMDTLLSHFMTPTTFDAPAGRVTPSQTPGTPDAVNAAQAALQAATSAAASAQQPSVPAQPPAQQAPQPPAQQAPQPATQPTPTVTPHQTHGLPASCYNPAGHIRNRPGCRGG